MCGSRLLLYLLVTPLIPLWYYSNTWWLHVYYRTTKVTHGGCNVTLVIMQYLLMVPQVYYNIFCWVYWNPSVTTVSPGCDTGSKRHYSNFWWRHLYPSTPTVSSDDSTGRLIALQYILAALLETLYHYVIFCWRHWFLASLQYHLVAQLVPLCAIIVFPCAIIVSLMAPLLP